MNVYTQTVMLECLKINTAIKVESIHGTGKAFAGGKGLRGLCRLPAAKQTGKTGKGKWRI